MSPYWAIIACPSPAIWSSRFHGLSWEPELIPCPNLLMGIIMMNFYGKPGSVRYLFFWKILWIYQSPGSLIFPKTGQSPIGPGIGRKVKVCKKCVRTMSKSVFKWLFEHFLKSRFTGLIIGRKPATDKAKEGMEGRGIEPLTSALRTLWHPATVFGFPPAV